MAIAPDTKDWTWVLQRACPECGWDARSIDRGEVAGLIRNLASEWELVLGRNDVRTRPRDDVWSPLEYACHVRDVFALYDHRVQRMLDEDDPQYANWDQDATAIEQRYGEQDPSAVAPALVANATKLAARFDTVTDERWQRPGARSDGARFTIESLARYLVHDPVHHLHDVGVRFVA